MDERRTGWVLIVVLVGQLVYLAIQGARAGETRLEGLGLRLLGPMARGVASIPGGVAGRPRGGQAARHACSTRTGGCGARSRTCACACCG